MLLKDYKTEYKNTARSEGALPNFRGSIHLKVVVFSLLVLTSMIFAQLVFANNLATDGEKLSDVREEIKKLEKENMTLKTEIAKHSSLTKLSEKAQKSGFVKPESVILINKF